MKKCRMEDIEERKKEGKKGWKVRRKKDRQKKR